MLLDGAEKRDGFLCHIPAIGAHYRQQQHIAGVNMAEHSENQYVELLTACQSRLYGCIYALMGNVDQARDVLQETNRKLWQLRDDYDPSRSFAPWAYKVAYNQVRTARKRLQRERLIFHEEETIQAMADEHDSWSECHDDRRRALESCLNNLGHDQRRLVRDYFHGRDTMATLAEKLGCLPNTIAVTLRRIRHSLADCIRRKLA